MYYRDRVEEEDAENITDALLSVHKPEFQSFPNPDPSFENWLEWGWNDYRYKTRIKELILLPLDQMRLPEEPSDDDRERIDELNHTYKEFFTDMLRAIIAILLISANSRCVEPPFAIIRTYCF